MFFEIRKKLFEKTDEKYKTFNDALVPGTGDTIGVRVPEVRALAKKIASDTPEQFLDEIETQEADSLYQEELMLQGMVIGLARLELSERFRRLDSWVPRINSWAVCDCGNSTLKFLQKYPAESFSYICKWLNSEKEYELRFVVVTLMQYFITEEYIDRLLEIYKGIRHEGYYVKMGIAWAVSFCYIKFPEKTLELIKSGELEMWTHNKVIQKIRESRRVSGEEKDMLNGLKRKK